MHLPVIALPVLATLAVAVPLYLPEPGSITPCDIDDKSHECELWESRPSMPITMLPLPVLPPFPLPTKGGEQVDIESAPSLTVRESPVPTLARLEERKTPCKGADAQNPACKMWQSVSNSIFSAWPAVPTSTDGPEPSVVPEIDGPNPFQGCIFKHGEMICHDGHDSYPNTGSGPYANNGDKRDKDWKPLAPPQLWKCADGEECLPPVGLPPHHPLDPECTNGKCDDAPTPELPGDIVCMNDECHRPSSTVDEGRWGGVVPPYKAAAAYPPPIYPIFTYRYPSATATPT